MNREPSYLFYGSIISAALLILLMAIRLCCPTLLDIDGKWLGVAGAPLVIALIAGRYIKKFNGFGIDIEILEEPLFHNPEVIEYTDTTMAKEKSDGGDLYNMSKGEKQKYGAMSMQLGRRDYYESYWVSEYIKELRNVKFIILNDASGRFQAIVRIRRDIFENRNENLAMTDDFVEKVGLGDIQFKNLKAIADYVYENESVIDAAKKIRKLGLGYLAVLDERNIFVGIVWKRKLDACLANAVLRAYRDEKK